jgi:hypothetical protein
MGNTVGSLIDNVIFTPNERAFVLGTILGDAHLAKLKTDARLELTHSEIQKDYLLWKYEQLSRFVYKPPRYYEIHDERWGNVYKQWKFQTRVCSVFTEMYEIFYPSGKKIIPKNFKTILFQPKALAVWFMDDGGRRNDCYGLFLNTLSFTREEHQILQECLLDNFRIETRIHWIEDGFRIYIPSKEARKFCEIIYPYIIPSMLYKLSYNPVTTSYARLDRARDRSARSLL